MKTIDEVIGDVLVREAWPTVTDRPSDRGGLTKGGVTFRDYNFWRASKGLRLLTEAEFRNLSETDARAFLEDAFTRPFAFVGDESIRILLIDWAVNSGPDEPMKALQAALKLHGKYAGALDGVGGPKTRAAWSAIEGDFGACAQIENQLLVARVGFYLDCALKFDAATAAFIAAHPATQLRNLRGWINRTLEFL